MNKRQSAKQEVFRGGGREAVSFILELTYKSSSKLYHC